MKIERKFEKKLLSLLLALAMVITMVPMFTVTAFADETYTINFAMPKEYLDDKTIVRFYNPTNAVKMSTTGKDITIDDVEYEIYTINTSDKPVKGNSGSHFYVYKNIPTGTLDSKRYGTVAGKMGENIIASIAASKWYSSDAWKMRKNIIADVATTNWYSSDDWQYGENIVAVPLDYTGMLTHGATGYVTFYDMNSASEPAASDFSFTPSSNLTYDGTEKTATIKTSPAALASSIGAITVNYYKDGAATTCEAIDAGTYTVKIDVAKGTGYTSASGITDSSWTFVISPAALTVSGTTVASKVYDGTTAASVTVGSLTGVASADTGKVTVTATGAFADANVGTSKDVTVSYTLSGTAAGNYTAPQAETIKADITARDVSDLTIDAIPAQKHTGSEVKPEPTVKYGTTVLKKDTDYTVSYATNTDIGTAYATVACKGNFTGTTTVSFKILNPLFVSDFTVTTPSSFTYDGAEKKVTVTCNLATSTDIGEITVYYKGDDWSTTAPKSAGTYQFKIEVAESDKYAAATITNAAWTFTIEPDVAVDKDGKSEDLDGAQVDKAELLNAFNAFYEANKATYKDITKFEVKVDKIAQDSTGAAITSILATAAGVNFIGFDVDVELTYNNGSSKAAIADTISPMAIKYEFDYSKKKDIQVFRVHGTNDPELMTTDSSISGEYVEYDQTNSKVIVHASRYSTYAITYNVEEQVYYYIPETYTVSVPEAKNGSVTVSPKSAEAGTTVTLTVTPDKGYTLETITVTDKNGKDIELTAVTIGEKYTFKMPYGAVSIAASFMEDNTILNYCFDVNAEDYFYDAVLWAYENGITKGADDTHFNPNGSTTRGEMITFLWRAAGSPVVDYVMPFEDVEADAYYTEAVRWAAANGVTNGVDATHFAPGQTISRAEEIAFLWKYAGKLTETAANPFADVDANAYYYDAVVWAKANAITNGTSDTTFSPADDCLRGQVVSFLYNYFAK